MMRHRTWNNTTAKLSKSRKQSFPFLRDTKGLLLGQGRATSSKGVDDSSGPKRFHRGARGLGYSSDLERSKCASGGIQGDKTPCFVRLRILEQIIHDLSLTGDSEGLRKALREYLELWIALERGEP